MRLASLPWYDLFEVQEAHDSLWAAIAEGLRGRGITEVPLQLERDMDYVQQWHRDDLLLGQACGYDVATWQSDRLTLLGTPHFDFEGCSGHRYRSFVVVRSDSSARSLDDLRRGRCAINTQTSHSGMNSLRQRVGPLHPPYGYFGEVVVSGGHEHSVKLVASGRVDVAAVDCISYGLLARHRPAAVDALKVLCETDLAPAPPFVTSARTPAREVAALREVLHAVAREAGPSCGWSPLRLSGITRLTHEAYAGMRPPQPDPRTVRAS